MRDLPGHPGPERVHKLRTRIREIEALLQALLPENPSRKNTLQTQLKTIRKRAGNVRDMDVLIGLVTGLKTKSENDSRARLIEYLSRKRIHAVRRLLKALAREGKPVRNGLKKCFVELKKELSQSPHELSSAALRMTCSIWTELREWPPLREENLHPFRLKVKTLRSILQLTVKPDTNLVDTLGAVKDAIGEWHDWDELLSITEDVLRRESASPLLREIRTVTRAKLQHALTLTRSFRKNYPSDEIQLDSSVTQDGHQAQVPECLLSTQHGPRRTTDTRPCNSALKVFMV